MISEVETMETGSSGGGGGLELIEQVNCNVNGGMDYLSMNGAIGGGGGGGSSFQSLETICELNGASAMPYLYSSDLSLDSGNEGGGGGNLEGTGGGGGGIQGGGVGNNFEQSLITLNDISNSYHGNPLASLGALEGWSSEGIEDYNWISNGENYVIPHQSQSQTPASGRTSLYNFYEEDEKECQKDLDEILKQQAFGGDDGGAGGGVMFCTPSPPPINAASLEYAVKSNQVKLIEGQVEDEEDGEEDDDEENEEDLMNGGDLEENSEEEEENEEEIKKIKGKGEKVKKKKEIRQERCLECEMDFPLPCRYERHMEEVHGEKFPYACEHDGCSKKFAKHHQRQQHGYIHDPRRFEGEGKWGCGLCEKKYHVRCSLYQHWKTSHPGVGPEERKELIQKAREEKERRKREENSGGKEGSGGKRRGKGEVVLGVGVTEDFKRLKKRQIWEEKRRREKGEGMVRRMKGRGRDILKMYKCRVCGRDDFEGWGEVYGHRVGRHGEVEYDRQREKPFGCGICLKPYFLREDAIICSLLGHEGGIVGGGKEGKRRRKEREEEIRRKGIGVEGMGFERPLYFDLTERGPSEEEQHWVAGMVLEVLGRGRSDVRQVCTLCGEETSNKGNFKRHLMGVHVSEEMQRMEEMGKGKEEKDQGEAMEEKGEPPKKKIKEEEKVGGGEGKGKEEMAFFKCRFCDKEFGKKRALHFHEVRGHINPKAKGEGEVETGGRKGKRATVKKKKEVVKMVVEEEKGDSDTSNGSDLFTEVVKRRPRGRGRKKEDDGEEEREGKWVSVNLRDPVAVANALNFKSLTVVVRDLSREEIEGMNEGKIGNLGALDGKGGRKQEEVKMEETGGRKRGRPRGSVQKRETAQQVKRKMRGGGGSSGRGRMIGAAGGSQREYKTVKKMERSGSRGRRGRPPKNRGRGRGRRERKMEDDDSGEDTEEEIIMVPDEMRRPVREEMRRPVQQQVRRPVVEEEEVRERPRREENGPWELAQVQGFKEMVRDIQAEVENCENEAIDRREDDDDEEEDVDSEDLEDLIEEELAEMAEEAQLDEWLAEAIAPSNPNGLDDQEDNSVQFLGEFSDSEGESHNEDDEGSSDSDGGSSEDDDDGEGDSDEGEGEDGGEPERVQQVQVVSSSTESDTELEEEEVDDHEEEDVEEEEVEVIAEDDNANLEAIVPLHQEEEEGEGNQGEVDPLLLDDFSPPPTPRSPPPRRSPPQLEVQPPLPPPPQQVEVVNLDDEDEEVDVEGNDDDDDAEEEEEEEVDVEGEGREEEEEEDEEEGEGAVSSTTEGYEMAPVDVEDTNSSAALGRGEGGNRVVGEESNSASAGSDENSQPLRNIPGINPNLINGLPKVVLRRIEQDHTLNKKLALIRNNHAGAGEDSGSG